MASNASQMQSRTHQNAATLSIMAKSAPRGSRTPPPRSVAAGGDNESIRQQHLAAKAKRRQTQMQADMDRLPPILPCPFFTFHMPLPNQRALSSARVVKKPRHSAPAGGNPFLQAYHGQAASFKPFSNTYIPKRTKQYENAYELPSSDAIEPVRLHLQDEDIDMMDMDDISPELDDPFL